jgi:hypothetical protein
MKVIKEIKNYKVTIGSEQHMGWLPAGASNPLFTPAREVILNITIEHDGSGYLLCYTSSDGDIYGDTWHETLESAESEAFEYFGVNFNKWESLI